MDLSSNYPKVILVPVLFLFVATAVASFDASPPGCRLKIVNSGTPGNPNYGETTCEGNCVAPAVNPCEVKFFLTEQFESFDCYCNNRLIPLDEVNQGCVGTLRKITGGSWQIDCREFACSATCSEAPLPSPNNSVWACICPDAE